MEDTIKIELLTPLTGTFLPNEMEQDWEEEDYNDFEEEQVFFEEDDLTEYASVIQEKIAEYNRVGHDDDRTDNLMDYFDGSAAIKEKVVSAVPSVKESDGVLYGCTTLELKEYLEAEELSELCEYLTRQYSDGWGEGFEQQEIPVEGGELCIHFWRPIDFEFQQAKSEVSKEKSEKQENPVNVPKRLKMQLLGMDGNVFAVMARASKLLQENGQGQEAKEMIARVQKSENYYQALHIISEYVETELSASSQNDTKGELLRKTGGLLEREGYEVRVFDLINPETSFCYNPFAYVRDDKDVLKLINNLIRNTTPKGAQSSDPFWEKSETALLQALMLYLLHEAPPEEQNFSMIMEMLGSAQVKEDDEEYQSPLDILFERLEMRNPESIAVKQYAIYKQAAGVVSLKRLLNQSILKSWSSKMIKKSLEAYFFTLKNKIVFCKKQF